MEHNQICLEIPEMDGVQQTKHEYLMADNKESYLFP